MSMRRGPLERLSRSTLEAVLSTRSPGLLKFQDLRAILTRDGQNPQQAVNAIARTLQLKLNRKVRCSHWRYHKRMGTRCPCSWNRTIDIIWSVLRQEEENRHNQWRRARPIPTSIPGDIANNASGQGNLHPTFPSSPAKAKRKRRKRINGIRVNPGESLLPLHFDE
jgi:hypothetical protein